MSKYEHLDFPESDSVTMTGKVVSVSNNGYARRIVWLDNGRTFRIIKSQLAFAIDNKEYREESHTFVMTPSGIYLKHFKAID
jgi:hypothetical protein